MSDRPPTPTGAKPSAGGELIIPGLAVAFTIYYFTSIWESPWTAQVAAFFVGSILLALCVLLLGLLLRRRAAGGCTLGFAPLAEPLSLAPVRVALLTLTVAYAIAIQWAGFTVSTFLFLTLASLLLNRGRRKGFTVGLAAAMSLGGYLLFVVAFRTPFPEGPFEHAMKALF